MLLPNLIEIFCAARIYLAGACYIGDMGELYRNPILHGGKGRYSPPPERLESVV